MSGIHAGFANGMVLFYLVVGLWGVVLGIMKRPVDSSYRGALVLAEAVGVIQAVIGIILLITAYRPAQEVHYLYGVSAVVTLPLVQLYLANRFVRPSLGFGLGCLFMCGLAIRGISTGIASSGGQ